MNEILLLFFFLKKTIFDKVFNEVYIYLIMIYFFNSFFFNFIITLQFIIILFDLIISLKR